MASAKTTLRASISSLAAIEHRRRELLAWQAAQRAPSPDEDPLLEEVKRLAEHLESLQEVETEAPDTKLSSRPERTRISCPATIGEASECAFPQRKAHEERRSHEVQQEIRGSAVEGPAVCVPPYPAEYLVPSPTAPELPGPRRTGSLRPGRPRGHPPAIPRRLRQHPRPRASLHRRRHPSWPQPFRRSGR